MSHSAPVAGDTPGDLGNQSEYILNSSSHDLESNAVDQSGTFAPLDSTGVTLIPQEHLPAHTPICGLQPPIIDSSTQSSSNLETPRALSQAAAGKTRRISRKRKHGADSQAQSLLETERSKRRVRRSSGIWGRRPVGRPPLCYQKV